LNPLGGIVMAMAMAMAYLSSCTSARDNPFQRRHGPPKMGENKSDRNKFL